MIDDTNERAVKHVLQWLDVTIDPNELLVLADRTPDRAPVRRKALHITKILIAEITE